MSKDFTLFVVDVGTGNACLYTGFLAYDNFTVPFLVNGEITFDEDKFIAVPET